MVVLGFKSRQPASACSTNASTPYPSLGIPPARRGCSPFASGPSVARQASAFDGARGGLNLSAYRPLPLDEPALDLERLARLRQVLDAADLAGAVFFDPTNIRYATGTTNM